MNPRDNADNLSPEYLESLQMLSGADAEWLMRRF